MKNHLIYTLSGMLFLLTSCDAFLNQEPLDQLAPDEPSYLHKRCYYFVSLQNSVSLSGIF